MLARNLSQLTQGYELRAQVISLDNKDIGSRNISQTGDI